MVGSLHVGQNCLLAALWERDGSTQGEVAAALNATAPTVVKLADRMTAAELLTRRRDGQDDRLVRLRLTDAGRALPKPVEAERRLIEEKSPRISPKPHVHPSWAPWRRSGGRASEPSITATPTTISWPHDDRSRNARRWSRAPET
ncbi:MarR family transcriptional regulator [Streptomyces sp. NPDC005761]|uniref:MarR family winged helix-turn-helix transcriptional regulator n=1 Tax=unclassified Streptomyces TaxID=2593676 RepID=UPI0033F4B72A